MLSTYHHCFFTEIQPLFELVLLFFQQKLALGDGNLPCNLYGGEHQAPPAGALMAAGSRVKSLRTSPEDLAGPPSFPSFVLLCSASTYCAWVPMCQVLGRCWQYERRRAHPYSQGVHSLVGEEDK